MFLTWSSIIASEMKASYALDETRFLRDLRNYLFHYGVAPIIQSISIRKTEELAEWNHNNKLKASRLVEWR